MITKYLIIDMFMDGYEHYLNLKKEVVDDVKEVLDCGKLQGDIKSKYTKCDIYKENFRECIGYVYSYCLENYDYKLLLKFFVLISYKGELPHIYVTTPENLSPTRTIRMLYWVVSKLFADESISVNPNGWLTDTVIKLLGSFDRNIIYTNYKKELLELCNHRNSSRSISPLIVCSYISSLSDDLYEKINFYSQIEDHVYATAITEQCFFGEFQYNSCMGEHECIEFIFKSKLIDFLKYNVDFVYNHCLDKSQSTIAKMDLIRHFGIDSKDTDTIIYLWHLSDFKRKQYLLYHMKDIKLLRVGDTPSF